MLPKLSVRKPYTVAVFVALVLLLGGVSLSKMNTDLLPEMTLPYVVIGTTCPGMSPESVEMIVTKPIEQAMATVSDIKNVISTSSENFSILTLEFNTGTNMDSISLEIREKLDQISGYWDDTIGKPMVLKLNPNMLPVMVAAVEVEGLETTEVTEYVQNRISPSLESVSGVASVSTLGTVTESIEVRIVEDRLKAVNEMVRAAIRGQFDEKLLELEDAQAELDSGSELLTEGRQQLTDGKQQLADGKQQLADGLAEGQQKLSEAQVEIDSGTSQIDAQLQALEIKQVELNSGKAQLTQTQATLAAVLSTSKQARDALQRLIELRDSLAGQEQTTRSLLDSARLELEALEKMLVGPGESELDIEGTASQESTPELPAMSEEAIILSLTDGSGEEGQVSEAGDFAEVSALEPDDVSELVLEETGDASSAGAGEAALTESAGESTALLESTPAPDASLDVSSYFGQTDAGSRAGELRERISALEAGYEQLKASREDAQKQIAAYLESLGIKAVDEQEALMMLDEQIAGMETSLAELSNQALALEEAQVQLNAGREELNRAKEQIAAGQSQVISGQTQLTTQQVLATIEMSVTEAKLASAEAELTEKEATLSQAQEQLDSGRDQLNEAMDAAMDAASLEKLVSRELIGGILAGENFSMPAGYLTEGRDTWLVRVGDKVSDSRQLEDLVILDLGIDGLDPIRLKDVADVIRNDDSDEVYSRLNGKPGVQLSIQKQTGYSTGDVTDRLEARMEEISREEEGVHFTVMMNQGVYIDLVVNSVISNMLSGAVLAVLILLLFLKDLRSTFVIACSIPFSVVASFVLMYFSGITLNVISLSGLALGIGMLVDNSIVVIENIDRLRKLGVPPRLAAARGAIDVSGAIAASTLTTVCVFAPIVFTQGLTKQLFVDMGLTIAYSLGASLAVALTLVPAMSAAFVSKKKKKRRPEPIMDAVKKVYGKMLMAALRFKWLLLPAVLLLLVISVRLELKNGTAFMPDMESTQATMTVTAPVGATFQELTELTDEVVRRIQDLPDIVGVGASAGGGSSTALGMLNSSNSDSATIYLILSEDRQMDSIELQKEIEKRLEGLDGKIEISMQSMDMSAMGGSGVSVEISGRELDTLAELADETARILSDVPGLVNLDSGRGERGAEFRISVDKAKAMSYKLTVAQVFQAVNKRLSEASSTTTLSGELKDYPVYVVDERDASLTRELLENMELTYTDNENKEQKILLKEIAAFSEASTMDSINRQDQTRFIHVDGDIAPDYNVGLVNQEVQKRLEEQLKVPTGYSWELTGENSMITDAMEQLTLMMILAVIFIYLIMVAQFQSLRSPFIIMFTIPLAFTGGLFGLVAADLELSVVAVIGFVVLAGIIVNNGIVLVDYTNQLRSEGMGKKEALVRAGQDRLRPIIMTALTTILGLSTSALGVGMGSDMIQPMAVVTIGGLIYGTLLTLLIVPCLYDLMNGEKYKNYELEEDIDGGTEGQSQGTV